MNSETPLAPDTPDPDSNMDQATISRLLGMAAGPPVKPADALALRMQGEDGQVWAIRTLADPPVEGFDNKSLLRPPVDLEALRELHRLGKRRFHEAKRADEQHAGLLWYLMAIGIAIVDHGVKLSSQPEDEVVDAILVVADALPNPWRARLEAIDL